MSNEIVVSKICGLIYGQALGDAFGLTAEFEDEKSVKRMVQKVGKRLSEVFPYPFKTSHSERWANGDWTDDTDQMILIMQSLTANNLQANAKDFALRLYNWIEKGFPECGDSGGMGIGNTVFTVVKSKEFKTNPHTAAKKVWEANGKNIAPNGALMRTSVVSAVHFDNLDEVIENAKQFCLVTHADPRCVASVICINVILSLILQDKYKDDYEKVLNEAKEHSIRYLDSSRQINEFLFYFEAVDVNELQLDEPNTIGYTYKCMACGVMALREIIKYREKFNYKLLFEKIAMKGGDADTNLTVTGAICGAILGYENLDQKWLNAMPHKKRFLDVHVQKFLNALGYDPTRIFSAARFRESVDHILGMIYGQALGDAYGLAFEFESRESIEKILKNSEFPSESLSTHAGNWAPGDWTDDTDQMILIMQSLTKSNLKVDVNDFAERLINWKSKGFPQVDDVKGQGISYVVDKVTELDFFVKDPLKAAENIWTVHKRDLPGHDAVMRTSIISAVHYSDLKKVIKNSINFSMVTNFDPRCVASCICINVLLSLIVQNAYDGDYRKILECAKEHALKYLQQCKIDAQEFLNYFNAKSIDSLELSKSGYYCHTYKAMGCGVIALRIIIDDGANFNYKALFTRIAKRGGYSCTHLAVVGAVCGAVLGYSKLDKKWLNKMPYKENILDNEVKQFLNVLKQ